MRADARSGRCSRTGRAPSLVDHRTVCRAAPPGWWPSSERALVRLVRVINVHIFVAPAFTWEIGPATSLTTIRGVTDPYPARGPFTGRSRRGRHSSKSLGREDVAFLLITTRCDSQRHRPSKLLGVDVVHPGRLGGRLDRPAHLHRARLRGREPVSEGGAALDAITQPQEPQS